MTAILLLMLLGDITKEEVIKMAQSGAKDDEILAKIDADRSAFKLSAEDVVELRKAGVGEKVIRRMLGEGAFAGKGLEVVNKAGGPVALTIRDGEIEIGKGTEVAAGKTSEFEAREGEYKIVYRGKTKIARVNAPAKLTIKGSEVGSVDVLLVIIEDSKAREVCLLEVKDRPRAEARPTQRVRIVARVATIRFLGFEFYPGW